MIKKVLSDEIPKFEKSASRKLSYDSGDDYMERKREKRRCFDQNRDKRSKAMRKEMPLQVQEKSMMPYEEDFKILDGKRAKNLRRDKLYDYKQLSKSSPDRYRSTGSNVLKMMPANRMSKTSPNRDQRSRWEIIPKSSYIRDNELLLSQDLVSNYLADLYFSPKSLEDVYLSSGYFISSYMLHEGLLLLKQFRKAPPSGFSTSDLEMIDQITNWNYWVDVSPKFKCIHKKVSPTLNLVDLDKRSSKLGATDLSEDVFGASEPVEIVEFVTKKRYLCFHLWQCIEVILEVTPIDTGCHCKPNHFNISIYKTASKNISGKDLHVVLVSKTSENHWEQHIISLQGKPFLCNGGKQVKWGIHRFKKGTKVRLLFFWNNMKSPYELICREHRTNLSNACFCARCVNASIWKTFVFYLISCNSFLTEWANQEDSLIRLGYARNHVNIILLIIFMIVLCYTYF
jgi:hypothetical protein